MASPLIEIHKSKLPYLCKNTTNCKELVLYLHSYGIISENESEEIGQKMKYDGFFQLYSLLSKRLNPEVSSLTVKALRESGNNHIVEFLQSESPPLTPLQKNQEGHFGHLGGSVGTPKETVMCPPWPKATNHGGVNFHGGTNNTYNGALNVAENIKTKNYTTRGNQDHNH